MEGRLTKVDFKYLENSLVNCSNYNTYKESLKMRKDINYESTENSLHKELFLEIKNKNKIVYLSEESMDFDF